MSAICPSCGCHQPEGLLCHDDSASLETMLAAVPQLIDQLQVAISKQARISTGGKGGKGTAREQNPINFGALAVRDALLVELVTWAQDVLGTAWDPEKDRLVVFRAKTAPWSGPFHDQCQHPSCERMRFVYVEEAPPIGHQAAAGLLTGVNLIRRHPAADEIASGIGRAVKDAYRAIDRLAERTYLGTCMYEEDGATCHAEVWARPGAHQVTCSQCEITHEVAERRAWLLKQAEDMLCTVKEASRYVGEIGGIRVTEASIRGYLHRGQRLAYRPGTTMIRLGDLLAVVLDEGERKSA